MKWHEQENLFSLEVTTDHSMDEVNDDAHNFINEGDVEASEFQAIEEDRVSPDQIRPVIESLLLIVDLPVTEKELADAMGVQVQSVHETLCAWQNELASSCSGIQLRFIEGGWRLYTNPQYSVYVERFLRKGSRTKLSRAALETLAVVAYRQPVTRQEVAAIRGVGVDSIMRTLHARGLIAPLEKDDNTHNAQRYCTTQQFLVRLGLTDINQLPPIAGFLPERNTLEDFASMLEK